MGRPSIGGGIRKRGKPQISPLRCALAEMTKGRVVVAQSRGQGRKPVNFPLRYASVENDK
jgi:hypothetical protein